jgi:hypothetical protein
LKQPLSTVASITLMLLSSIGPFLASSYAQTAKDPDHPILLRAEIKPGEVLRYELQGTASFLPQQETAQWKLVDPAVGPCDYAVTAIVTLRAQPPDKDGNTPVEATYSDVLLTSVRCLPLNTADIRKRLAALQAAPTLFRVGPHGETQSSYSPGKLFDYWSGADLLRQVTQDLLQSQFSSAPVLPGAAWKPRGQFAYNEDPELGDLDLSAAEIRFRNFVQLAGQSLALVSSKYVFSPLDLPASATTRNGIVLDAAGHNAVAAILETSLLLDPASRHIAWLHRAQTVDNRLMFAMLSDEDENDDNDFENPTPARRPLLTFHFQEDGKARLLPDDRSGQGNMEWLAALRQFEQSPEPQNSTPATPAHSTGPITQAAHVAALRKTTRAVIDSDSLLSTPTGFSRFEKPFCRDAWFCATASVALPGKVDVVEDTPLRSVYFARKDDVAVSVAIGPVLDRSSRGLTDEEELQKQSKYYLADYVWLASKPGIETTSAGVTLDGYPGMIVEFNATQRDLSSIHGLLGLILTPWGKVVPVSCTSDRAEKVQSLCEQVVPSITLRR